MDMIRNEIFTPDGACIAAEVIDLDAGTIAHEDHGAIVSTRALTADEVARYAPPPPTDAEKLDAAKVALASLDGTPAPYTTADIVDILLDVKIALGG